MHSLTVMNCLGSLIRQTHYPHTKGACRDHFDEDKAALFLPFILVVGRVWEMYLSLAPLYPPNSWQNYLRQEWEGITRFQAMSQREPDCSQALKENRLFPGLFLIDVSVYQDCFARLLLAVQPREMTQFRRLIGPSHRVQVTENCRLCCG